MIKFFRNIRKNLLNEGKTTKYTKYAIGEIILVVIGILIALQINNWNEARKEQNLELALLEEMQENLKADIVDMQDNVGYHENSIESANIILSAFKNNISENDSLYKHFGKVTLAPKFLVTMNAYNSMNKEGMKLIKNDSLRNTITSHYQRNYAYLLSWNDSEWDMLFKDQQDIYRKYFKEYNYIGEVIPENYEELSKNSYYKNYLKNRIGFNKSSIKYYKVFGIKNAKSLIAQIEEELKNRN
ncbi:DUF6090 family protein [Sabulilitoribacter multivorans]|uniref:DUF6090 family protein n=1 Tax=Flaviramulus multivorans TaxID=1304750 RepID=A0ABS9IJZ2_9FLAO|nr:DUF6090 family protein [Flaviramulus multivorans]MCF7560920.1 DUF6090 family protein [Flaviramulus multivorans]